MTGGANSTNALYSYAIPATGGYDKNGNLLTVTDSVMGKWTYAYDNLNRLLTASAPTSQPTGVSNYFAGIQSSWSYDNFGNRLTETQGAIPGANPLPQAAMPQSSTATYNTSNQMTSATQNGGSALVYDAAGNVTFDGLNSYLYDAEGRICAVNTRSNPQPSDKALNRRHGIATPSPKKF
jgi:YD repeat-containing protein